MIHAVGIPMLPLEAENNLVATPGFVLCVALTMWLGIVVFLEPAPFDLVLMGCFAFGIIFGKLSFVSIGPGPFLCLGLFLLANLVSMYDPFDSSRAVFYFIVTLYLVLSWCCFVGLLGRYGGVAVRPIFNVYCAAGILSAVLGIVGYFHLIPGADILLLQGRARGLFKDCNVYGPYLVPIGLIALLWISRSNATRKLRLVASGMLLVVSAGMLLSFSRACWINFGISLMVLVVGWLRFAKSKDESRRLMMIVAFSLVVALVGIGLSKTIPAVQKMWDLRVTTSGLHDYDRVRFATQSLALETAKDRPLGIGPGQSEIVFNYAAHSTYVRLITENGIISLAAFLCFIAFTVRRSLRNLHHLEDQLLREINIVVIASIAGHLVNSAVIDTVHWRHIWFVAALPWIPVEERRFA